MSTIYTTYTSTFRRAFIIPIVAADVATIRRANKSTNISALASAIYRAVIEPNNSNFKSTN